MDIKNMEIENILDGDIDYLPGKLGELQRFGYAGSFPIVKKATAQFLSILISIKKPKKILEIGCCIGFSASVMAKNMDENGHITTIDRFPLMIEHARRHFKEFNLEDKITLLEGNAQDILPDIDDKFDFIFIDAAKGQYTEFLHHALRLLKDDGVLLIDDVLFKGLIEMDIEDVPKRQRTIHRRMRAFLLEAENTKGLRTSLIPIDDGLLLCVKD